MNGKNLLDKISDVDPKLIADADKTPRHSRKLFIGITSGAATVAAAALIAVTIGNNAAQKPPVINTGDPNSISSGIVSSGNTSAQDPTVVDLTPKDPPKLDFSKYKELPKISSIIKTDVTGWGTEGSNIAGEKSSPWKGAVLETMPVYMSSATDLDLEHMYEYMRSVAAAFGISEDELEITQTGYPEKGANGEEYHRKIMEEHGVPEEEIVRELDRMRKTSMQFTEVTGKADGIEFQLRPDYMLEIIFTTSVELPEEYNFSKDASPEEKEKVMRYLTEKYSKALGYNKPTLKDESETFKAVYKVYDADGDLEQQIVNYWLNNTRFTEDSDEAGKLKSIVVRSLAGCEKIGDYPILTPEQAEAILKSTKYNDDNRMPLDANILKVDLVYNNSIGSTGIIPYYEFLIDNDEESDHRGFYTIPAVPEEFIDMETDDYGVYA